MAETPDVPSCSDENKTVTNFTELYSPFNVPVQTEIPVNEKEVRAGLLFDAVDNKVIWQKNMTTAYPIASLTKMMVALLAVEDIKAGLYSWNDNIKWTREIVIGRRKHRKTVSTNVSYSMLDVFKAAMIASNNECAEQLAKYIGCGNLKETIDRMNARAKSLGMVKTFFGNPTGLPAAHVMFDNSSTPSDLLLLTLEMLKYTEVLEIASMGYANIDNGKATSVISNHNHLTIDYSGEVDGLKTGYTRRAGFCLVATTAKCDHRLVSIVLGCRGPQIRNDVVRDMVNDYYTNIGLDRLGPNTNSPLIPANEIASNGNSNKNYITITEPVKKTHTVKKGENISVIAAKYNCTIAQVKNWNKNSIRNNRLISGQRLVVYVNKSKQIYIQNPVNGDEAEDDKPLMTASEKNDLEAAEKIADVDSDLNVKPAAETASNYFYYVVVPGDTLFNIARRYDGMTVDELKSLNNLYDGRSLKPGTKLKVKVKA